jgi:hypothetical protein
MLFVSLLVACSSNDEHNNNNNGDNDSIYVVNCVYGDLIGIWGFIDSEGNESYLLVNHSRGFIVLKQYGKNVIQILSVAMSIDDNLFCLDADCLPFSCISDGRFILDGDTYNRLEELPAHIIDAWEW